jgi:hypothetical protein
MYELKINVNPMTLLTFRSHSFEGFIQRSNGERRQRYSRSSFDGGLQPQCRSKAGSCSSQVLKSFFLGKAFV